MQNRDNFVKELKSLEESAAAGDEKAQFKLGLMYDDGNGAPQDIKNAIKYYKMAADQGNARAQLNLSMCYGTLYQNDNQQRYFQKSELYDPHLHKHQHKEEEALLDSPDTDVFRIIDLLCADTFYSKYQQPSSSLSTKQIDDFITHIIPLRHFRSLGIFWSFPKKSFPYCNGLLRILTSPCDDEEIVKLLAKASLHKINQALSYQVFIQLFTVRWYLQNRLTIQYALNHFDVFKLTKLGTEALSYRQSLGFKYTFKEDLKKQFDTLCDYVQDPKRNMRENPEKYVAFLENRIRTTPLDALMPSLNNWNNLLEDALQVKAKEEYTNSLRDLNAHICILQGYLSNELYRESQFKIEEADTVRITMWSKVTRIDEFINSPHVVRDMIETLFCAPEKFSPTLSVTECQLRAFLFANQAAHDPIIRTLLVERLMNKSQPEANILEATNVIDPLHYFLTVRNLMRQVLQEKKLDISLRNGQQSDQHLWDILSRSLSTSADCEACYREFKNFNRSHGIPPIISTVMRIFDSNLPEFFRVKKRGQQKQVNIMGVKLSTVAGTTKTMLLNPLTQILPTDVLYQASSFLDATGKKALSVTSTTMRQIITGYSKKNADDLAPKQAAKKELDAVPTVKTSVTTPVAPSDLLAVKKEQPTLREFLLARINTLKHIPDIKKIQEIALKLNKDEVPEQEYKTLLQHIKTLETRMARIQQAEAAKDLRAMREALKKYESKKIDSKHKGPSWPGLG